MKAVLSRLLLLGELPLVSDLLRLGFLQFAGRPADVGEAATCPFSPLKKMAQRNIFLKYTLFGINLISMLSRVIHGDSDRNHIAVLTVNSSTHAVTSNGGDNRFAEANSSIVFAANVCSLRKVD